MKHEAITVRCPQCELNQTQRELCRRCKKPLPKPLVHTVVKLVDTTFGPTAEVLPLDVLKRRAVIHALKKSSNIIEAAKRLRIGKTTLYRMMHLYGIMRKGNTAIIPEEPPRPSGLPPEQNYLFEEVEV